MSLLAIALGCYFAGRGRSICDGYYLNVGSTGADESQAWFLSQGSKQFACDAIIDLCFLVQLYWISDDDFKAALRQTSFAYRLWRDCSDVQLRLHLPVFQLYAVLVTGVHLVDGAHSQGFCLADLAFGTEGDRAFL